MPRTYIRRAGDRRPTSSDGRRIRFYVPRWVDPFWWIQGSKPEKMVIAELVRRGIYFEHTPQTNTLGAAVDPTWEPDFLFPQFKIWMEVNGFYFHTLPGAPEADALRYATIEAAGWKVVVWWDFDILARLTELCDDVPEFYQVSKVANKRTDAANPYGLPFLEGGQGLVDHLKGLRTALSHRARTPQFHAKHRTLGNAERHAK